MAMIYAVGDVSGAHLNPAVTLGFWLARRLPGRLVVPYMICQLAGAMSASVLMRLMFGNRVYLGATLPAGPAVQSFILEAVLTAVLMFVILCVSTGPKEIGVMAGIAVGGIIGLEAMFAGPISGASMNPVRSIAPAVVSGHLAHLWVYVAAPILGAAIAVPCWRVTRPDTLPVSEAAA
jgi:aquaporin Z